MGDKPNIIIVDDFLEDPLRVRELGLRLKFQEDNRYFRGQRSTTQHLWPGLRERFEDLLRRKIIRWEEYSTNGVFQWCSAGTQVVFHSDAQSFAGVIYLTPDAPPQSGTSLYRSKTLKGRTVIESAALAGISVEDAERIMYTDKLLDPTAWELVDSIGNRFNRLVLWNGKLVHAANNYFGTTKENSRFFQIFFFDVEES